MLTQFIYHIKSSLHILLSDFDIFSIQQYREDEKDCQKLYSNPEMFFDLWKEDFINKMEEERKKRREAMKARKQARQKQKQENKRKEKTMEDMVTIVPRWVIMYQIFQRSIGHQKALTLKMSNTY